MIAGKHEFVCLLFRYVIVFYIYLISIFHLLTNSCTIIQLSNSANVVGNIVY